jgi:cytochrome c biogenesis protein
MPLPFEVRCESFELENYPDGRPKDYLSRLSVLKDGQVVQEKTIEVNHPLIQDGIFFYQSSYRFLGGGAVLQILDRDGTPRGRSIRVAEGGAARVPGNDLGIRVLRTSQDYQGFGPAAQVTLVKTSPGREPVGEPFAVFQNYPQFDSRRGGEFVVQLSGLVPGRASTGLQVAKDPGVPFIWAGSILITLGTMMAFFASHRRIWVRLEADRITLAGAASRNLGAFREVFNRLEDELRGRTAPAEGRLRAAS